MKKYSLFIVISFLFLLSSCLKEFHWLKGEGPIVSEFRKLDAYEGIELAMSANVTFIKDTIHKIVIKAQSNIMQAIETKLHGNHLLIREYQGYHLRKHLPIEIIVHGKELNHLEILGSGDIQINSPLYLDQLFARISGSGNIHIKNLYSDQLEARITGSGDIKTDGESKHVFATITGSGNMRTAVSESLNATITGSGDIYYKGDPVITSNISGSGRIIKD